MELDARSVAQGRLVRCVYAMDLTGFHFARDVADMVPMARTLSALFTPNYPESSAGRGRRISQSAIPLRCNLRSPKA